MQTFKSFYIENQDLQNEGFGKYLGAAALATSLLTSPVKTETSTNKPAITFNINKFSSFLIESEGYREYAYKDLKGNLTIGVGHLIVKSDKDLFFRLLGIQDFNSICNKTSKLNKSQIIKLLNYDIQRFQRIAHQKYKKFNEFPEKLQFALLDSLFRGEVHPKADALINQGKWKEAAKEYLNDNEFRKSEKKKDGIFKRMLRNAHIIAKGTEITSAPIG